MLAEAMAMLEAAVDFPDEELPQDLAERARPPIARLQHDLIRAQADARRGERVREGYRIALIGAPNAGKSRLFNALLAREAAIVTATPGTTRDVLEAPLVIAGFKVLLADMAGLRETAEAIEGEGVRRARAWAEGADLRLWVVDASAASGAWREASDLVRPADILVLAKADLAAGRDGAEAASRVAGAQLTLACVSAQSGEGLGALSDMLAARVAADLSGAEFPPVTRARHARALAEALAHLERADRALETPELAAEDLRLAARALERVTGRIGVEDVLDVIFASFCIGK
jgi:tRNA modification GTPase